LLKKEQLTPGERSEFENLCNLYRNVN